MELSELMSELLSELGKVAKMDAIVGEVQDAGKAKVLPLSRVRLGFGTAVADVGGKSERVGDAGAQGGGAGGAVVVEPRAFVVVGEDGVPHLLALEPGKGAVARRGIQILAEPSSSPKLEGSASPRLGPSKNGT